MLAGVPNSTFDALNSANAISDKKLVAGLAASGVDQHAFAILQPAAVLLLIGGGVGLAGWLRGRLRRGRAMRLR